MDGDGKNSVEGNGDTLTFWTGFMDGDGNNIVD